MGLGWFPSISSGLNWRAGQLRLPLATAATNSRMRLDLYLSGGRQTLNLFVANFSVPERQVSLVLDHIQYFYQEPWYPPPAGSLTSVGSPLHLNSFAFFLTAKLFKWVAITHSLYLSIALQCDPWNFLLEDHQWWLAQFCFYSISFAKSQKPQEFWIFLAALNALLPEIPWHQPILNVYFFSAALLFL